MVEHVPQAFYDHIRQAEDHLIDIGERLKTSRISPEWILALAGVAQAELQAAQIVLQGAQAERKMYPIRLVEVDEIHD